MSYLVNPATFDAKKRAAYLAAADAEVNLGRRVSVSVVIPCFNEERFISGVLQNLSTQFDHESYELIVVDGRSTDNTRQVVADFAEGNPHLAVRIIDNPARNIPVALNLGIREARGEYIVRMDAHSVPSAGYVRRCVELLTPGEISIVGMPWQIRPGTATIVAEAIAHAVAHPFGIGDAQYRLQTSTSQLVDTVPFGAFKKSLWTELGGFNEELMTNEDYDFNYRVRKKGGKVLLDSREHSNYFARATLRELAIQYFRYGYWKAQMVKLHPRSIRLRHLVAPAFVSSLVVFGLLSFFWIPALWVLLVVLGSYILLASLFALSIASRNRQGRLFVILPVVFLLIHWAWGLSFLLGLGMPLRRQTS